MGRARGGGYGQVFLEAWFCRIDPQRPPSFAAPGEAKAWITDQFAEHP